MAIAIFVIAPPAKMSTCFGYLCTISIIKFDASTPRNGRVVGRPSGMAAGTVRVTSGPVGSHPSSSAVLFSGLKAIHQTLRSHGANLLTRRACHRAVANAASVRMYCKAAIQTPLLRESKSNVLSPETVERVALVAS